MFFRFRATSSIFLDALCHVSAIKIGVNFTCSSFTSNPAGNLRRTESKCVKQCGWLGAGASTWVLAARRGGSRASGRRQRWARCTAWRMR